MIDNVNFRRVDAAGVVIERAKIGRAICVLLEHGRNSRT